MFIRDRAMISREELSAWLHLLRAPGVGRATVRRLLAAFGSPQAALRAGEVALSAVVGPALASAVARAPGQHVACVDATWRWLESADPAAPRDVLTLGDPAYPENLLQTADPPLALYTCGRAALLSVPAVAIVGSRHATVQGLDNARAFARFLSANGHAVVSGLALGVDAAAHEGALEAPGSTIAFVGTGLDLTYPPKNARLANRIAHEGVLVSEYSLGTPPLASNFPRRNRLIAGHALGTLVVEATVRSGSLITARLAAEAGREVFALPGSIHSPQARGCHRLIQEGAKLVETGEDILQELHFPSGRARPHAPDTVKGAPPSVPADARLLDALGYDPATLDALSARTGWTVDRLAVRLLDLELAGHVERLPGGLVQRRGRA
jgi:DNA processing protein